MEQRNPINANNPEETFDPVAPGPANGRVDVGSGEPMMPISPDGSSVLGLHEQGGGDIDEADAMVDEEYSDDDGSADDAHDPMRS